MTLVKIKHGLTGRFVADIFGVSNTLVTKIFVTWTAFLAREMQHLIHWPSRNQIKSCLPKCFKNYPNTRVIIDCTEFQVEKSKTPTAQIQTSSEYKQRNTLKCLVGISPSGAFTFISKLWSGNVSDKELTKKCGILDLLEAGDNIMADRGFTIRDYCTERGCTLNIPPFSKGKLLSSKQVTKTRRIASSRIHVERAIERLKNFSFLQKVIPLKVKHTIDNVVMICAAICNLYPKLAK